MTAPKTFHDYDFNTPAELHCRCGILSDSTNDAYNDSHISILVHSNFLLDLYLREKKGFGGLVLVVRYSQLETYPSQCTPNCRRMQLLAEHSRCQTEDGRMPLVSDMESSYSQIVLWTRWRMGPTNRTRRLGSGKRVFSCNKPVVLYIPLHAHTMR